MSLHDHAVVLADRAAHAGLTIEDPLASQLVVYYQLLTHWNRKINLTSLSDPDEAIDRLLLEPVAAAASLPQGAELIDLGSGGGSPAVPLALSSRATRLVMVESRERKAAFLREVVRELGLAASVESRRFEDLPQVPAFAGAFTLLSVRAVRLDQALFETVARLLKPGATVALFRSVDAQDPVPGLPPSLQWIDTRHLIPASHSVLTRLIRST